MGTGDDEAGFARALAALVGTPVLWHISDPRSGVLLDLGDPVEKKRPTNNPTLTETQRNYQGESSVFITCTWYLSAPADQLQPIRADGVDERSQLSIVVGTTVADAATTPNRRLLQLGFDNGSRLVADLSDSSELQGYTVNVKDEYWSVLNDGRLRHEIAGQAARHAIAPIDER